MSRSSPDSSKEREQESSAHFLQKELSTADLILATLLAVAVQSNSSMVHQKVNQVEKFSHSDVDKLHEFVNNVKLIRSTGTKYLCSFRKNKKPLSTKLKVALNYKKTGIRRKKGST